MQNLRITESLRNAKYNAEPTVNQHLPGYSRKGAALTYLGRLREARATYQQGLEVDPNNQQLKEGLSDVEEEIKGKL